MPAALSFTGRAPEPRVPTFGLASPRTKGLSSSKASRAALESAAPECPAHEMFLAHERSGGGGKLNYHEIQVLVESTGVDFDPLFLRGMFSQQDTEGTGRIDYESFQELWKAIKQENALIGRNAAVPLAAKCTSNISFEARGDGLSTVGLPVEKQ